LGIVVAAAGAALSFFEDIGKLGPVKAGWAAIALLALWFLGGATGIWADINERNHDFMTHHWKADMTFFIISSVVWIATIAVAVVDPLGGGGCELGGLKFIAIGLLAFSAVLFVIVMALAAADRAGHGASVTVGEVSYSFKTSPHWAAFAIVGSVLGIVLAAAGIGLAFLGLWEKDEAISRYIRTAWVFFAAFALWLVAAMCGIWSYWVHERSHASEVGPGYNFMPYSAYFKAEFAFEIISSIVWIASIVVLAAFNAGGKDA